MESVPLVNVVVYYDGCVSSSEDQGVKFWCEEPTCFSIPQTISFEELNARLCQSVNEGIEKTVERIRYRFPVSFFGGFIQYRAVTIRGNDIMRVMFETYRQYRQHLTSIELYVDFKEVVAQNHRVDDVAGPSSNQTSRRNVEAFLGPYPFSRGFDRAEASQFPVISAGCEIDINKSGSDNDVSDDFDNSEDDEGLAHATANPFMRALDLEAKHAPEVSGYANMDSDDVADDELCVGMQFRDKDAVVQAVKDYSISKSVDYKVYESEPATFYCKCKHFGSGCQWLIRVSLKKKKNFWEISKYKGPHTCTNAVLSQDHTKLDSDTIARHIEPSVRADPSFKVKQVIAEVQNRYGYMTTYRKAWMAKQKAIERIHGNWYSSYQELPRWLEAMCHVVPHSRVDFDLGPARCDNELLPDKVLHRLFWAFGPCIKAFMHCKPLVQVDGTHLHGPYKGVLLTAVAQDGNQNVLPLAFAIVEDETIDSWSFFLSNLRRHVVTMNGVSIISDHLESINAAMRQSGGQWQPPRAFHRYCIKHIVANFQQRFEKPYLDQFVMRIGYSRIEREFNRHYNRLRLHGEIYTNWLDEIPREKWVQAFDGGYRYGHMTSNLVKSVNSSLKGTCNLPITALVRSTYFWLNELFVTRGKEAYARKHAGNAFSEAITTQLQENQQAAENIRVQKFSRQEVFLVQDLSNRQEFNVDLRKQYCDCGDFQIDRYPCCHVIACCLNQKMDWHHYVNVVYSMDKICKVYEEEFGVVGHQSTWPQYTGPKIIPNPELKRNTKGRHKSMK